MKFKVMVVRECATVVTHVETPRQAYDYWKVNVETAPWFDVAKECVVVLIVNTRKRIIGHNLVTLGLLNQAYIHSREVFRPAIVAAGMEILLMHNLRAATHKLCYAHRQFMRTCRLAVLTLTRIQRRKECYA